MARTITLDVEFLPEQVYLATSADVPGLVVQMNSIAGVVEVADDLSPHLLEWREGKSPGPLAFVVRECAHESIAAE